jgi:hypothetical protein
LIWIEFFDTFRSRKMSSLSHISIPHETIRNSIHSVIVQYFQEICYLILIKYSLFIGNLSSTEKKLDWIILEGFYD